MLTSLTSTRVRVGNYGLTKWSDLFTPRQLVSMATFSDLLSPSTRDLIHEDAVAVGLCDDDRSLDADGNGTRAYAEAVSVYLAFCLDKMADLGNSLVTWEPIAQCPRHLLDGRPFR